MDANPNKPSFCQDLIYTGEQMRPDERQEFMEMLSRQRQPIQNDARVASKEAMEVGVPEFATT